MVTLDDLSSYYDAQVGILSWLQSNVRLAIGADGPFDGLSSDELLAELRVLRDELDAQVSMMVIAAAESAVRVDFESRCQPKARRDLLRDAFLKLVDKYDKRVRLDDILDVWREQTGETGHGCVGRFKQVLLRRHWLAHGRRWADKSGVPLDPAYIRAVVDGLFRVAQQIASDFPRS